LAVSDISGAPFTHARPSVGTLRALTTSSSASLAARSADTTNVSSPNSKSAQTPRITHGPCGASSPTPSSSIKAASTLERFQRPSYTTSIRYDPVTVRLLFRAQSSWVHGLLAFVSLDSPEKLQDSLIVEFDALEDFLQFVGNLANRR